ncbi:MAG: selenocysteine-specific translation elongation factor [Chloroflexota bacterium]
MTVVVGTAGHIDHGKTTLLRALTGIDADRLPEERRRGMTIDVGYAHLAFDDGTELDFVDVPGHDRLVGNMLVGAGEIDAALLVVAADDGPRAQTLEHLELLDALGIGDGVAVVTKVDLAGPDRTAEVAGAVRGLLERTTLRGSPVLAVSSTSGAGLAELRAELAALRDRVLVRAGATRSPARLAIDRVFAVRGRGTVVTGTLRGGPLGVGARLRLEPDGRLVRVRELQVHGRPVVRFGPDRPGGGGGRVALNLVGVEAADLRRGQLLATGPAVVAADRLIVAIRPPAALGRQPVRWPLAHGAAVRLHLGTAQVEATVRRGRRDTAGLPSGEEVVRLVLARPVAASLGERFVLRWPSPPGTAAGGRILDPAPALGVSRRRADPDRLRALGEAVSAAAGATDDAGDDLTGLLAALTALHGILPPRQALAALAAFGADEAALGALGERGGVSVLGGFLVAPDVLAALETDALEGVAGHHAARPLSGGLALGELRPIVVRSLRRLVTVSPADASAIAGALLDRLVDAGRLARDGDLVRDPSRPPGLPAEVLAAMDRLEAALSVPAPPPLAEAVRAAGCPAEGVRALESAGRIVRLDADLAYASSTYAQLERLALRMAAAGPLAPAAFRDATGTSRKFSLAVLEELDRRALLRRTPDGHVLGPRAPRDR